MGLSTELASQFSKATDDSDVTTTNTTLHGTIIMYGDVPYVQIDGSDEITPVSRTVEVSEGDRVEVTISNHNATVVGNTTSPSIGVMEEGDLYSSITQTAAEIRLEVRANTADIVELQDSLETNIGDLKTSIAASIAELQTDIAENTEGITNLQGELASEVAELLADIDNLETTLTGEVSNLQSSITQTASDIRAEVSATVTNLESSITANSDSISNLETTFNAEVANLNSSIEQTAAEIRTEVSAEFDNVDVKIEANSESLGELDAKYAAEVIRLESSIEQTASSITLSVTQQISGIESDIDGLESTQEEFSIFKQTVEGFSFMNAGGTVKISGGDIELTGSITWSDLDSDAQEKVEDAQDTADSAVSTANSANSTANSAYNMADDAYDLADDAYDLAYANQLPDYIQSTYIDAVTIKSPTIEANTFNVYASSSGTGSFNIYGYFGTTLFHMFELEYYPSDVPYVYLRSPAGGEIVIDSGSTYGVTRFTGSVYFEEATVYGLTATFG